MNINHEFIKETVRAHYILQLGTHISELTDVSGIRFCYTCHFTNYWCNHAYGIEIEPSQVDELISKVESYASKKDREPCIYVSPATKPSNLGGLLEARGYEKAETEAWMFYDFSQHAKPYVRPAEITILDVQTDADFELYADIRRGALPYSEVEFQIQACLDGFKYQAPMVNVTYLVASYNGEPAGIVSLLRLGEYAELYTGATIDRYQKKGVIRALFYEAKSILTKNGVKNIFFQTIVPESEAAFKKLGYSTLYIRECYMPTSGKKVI